MAEKRTVSFGDINPEPVPVEEESFMLLMPSGGTSLKECNRTAEPTLITNGGTQRDRGIEFDFTFAVMARTQPIDE
jgi:hypothetical protein